MGDSQRPRKRSAAAPEAVAAELRVLIREAHEAMRGLKDIIREAKQTIPAAADELVEQVFQDKVNPKIKELDEFLQAESVRVSEMMQEEAVKGRKWIMDNMQPVAVVGGFDNPAIVFGQRD